MGITETKVRTMSAQSRLSPESLKLFGLEECWWPGSVREQLVVECDPISEVK